MARTNAARLVQLPTHREPVEVRATVEPNLTNRLAGLRLESIESFVVLSDELHFTRTAQRLHLSQPGLSRRISLLERQVGSELVQRSARQVRLTVAGLALLPYARKLLAVAREAQLALP